MPSIRQNLQPFIGNGHVPLWVKNSQVWRYCSVFFRGWRGGGGGFVPQQNVSFTMRHPLYQSTAANFSTIVATHGYWAASFLIRGIPTVTRIICFWAFSREAVTLCFKWVRRCWDSNTQRSACEENAQTDCGYTAAKTPC